jgi:hypothetical protein
MDNNNAKAVSDEQIWQAEVERRDEIKALDSSIQSISSERTQLDTHFAKSSDVVPFLDTLGALGTQVGTKIQVVSVNISQDNNGLLVELKASGTFEALYKYITLLENSPYEIEFSGMDLQKDISTGTGAKGAKASMWNMVLNIKLLSFIN